MWGPTLALLLTGTLSGAVTATQHNLDHAADMKASRGDAAAYHLSQPMTDPFDCCARDNRAAGSRSGLISRDRMITIAPKPSATPSETHAALVVSGDRFQGNVTFDGDTFIDEQLRTRSQANPWETAWLVWHYADNDHFYYFALKMNGWELGKRDPRYAGGQRFLASGDDITFATGTWYRFHVAQHDATMTVAIDGKDIVTFTDRDAAYTGGKVGIYSEDARVRLDQVSGSVTDNFEAYKPQPLHDGVRLGKVWEVAFLGFGQGSVMSDRLVFTPTSVLEHAHDRDVATLAPEPFAPMLASR